MHQRRLGQQGLEVSAIGLGTMGMTMAYGGEPDVATGVETIRRAHDLGVTFFDTAELYGNGTGSNEQIVGEAVDGFSDDVVIATKFGFALPDRRRPAAARQPAGQHPQGRRQQPAYLGIDYIDVLTSTASTRTCRSRTSRAPSRS